MATQWIARTPAHIVDNSIQGRTLVRTSLPLCETADRYRTCPNARSLIELSPDRGAERWFWSSCYSVRAIPESRSVLGGETIDAPRKARLPQTAVQLNESA